MKNKTEFDFGFIDRTIRTTCIVLLIFFPFGIYYLGLFKSMAILSGGIWGILNLILISFLVRSTLRPEGPDMIKAITIAFVKFPLLYLGGYFLLMIEEFDEFFLLIGFTGLLAIIVLKILGRGLMGLDKQNQSEHDRNGLSAI